MRLRIGICLFTMMVGACTTPAPTPDEMVLPPDAFREVMVIRGLVRMGAVDQATARLARIADSEALFDLRTLREFEPLWVDPVAQTYLRPEAFAERHIAAAKAKAQRNPTDLRARYQLIYALHSNGEFDEAVEVGEAELRNSSAYRTNGEAEGWVRNHLAYALMARGEIDAANAALKPMVRRASAREPYLVNFSIDYSLMLLGEERYDEARSEGRLAELDPVSNYGRNLLRYVDACALHGLGQRAEADMALDAILEESELRHHW